MLKLFSWQSMMSINFSFFEVATLSECHFQRPHEMWTEQAGCSGRESQLTSEMGTGIDCWIVRRRVGIRTMILLAHPFSINSLLFVCASQLDLKCLLQVSMSWNPEGWQVFCYYLPRQEKGAKCYMYKACQPVSYHVLIFLEGTT